MRRKIAIIELVILVAATLGCSAVQGNGDDVSSSINASSVDTTSAVDSNCAVNSGDAANADASVDADSPSAIPTLVESTIPSGDFQLDVSFPDWQDKPSSTYAVNNRVSFYGYEDQGVIYVCPDSDCDSFSLYINGYQIPTDNIETSHNYQLDISAIAVNGINSIQVSDVTSGNVRVAIPYPVVISGTLEDSGISADAIDVIDKIITADIENGFSSAQLAIVKDGKLVYANSWGNIRTYDEKGNLVDEAPVTNDSLYDLASNTKMYSVNYAIQYLMTNGQISLDDRIVDILGKEFADDTIEIAYEGYDAVSLETNKAWKSSVTVKDLLMHQGGFPAGPNYYNDRYDNATFDFDSDNENILYVGTGADAAAREETLKQICRTPLMYKPGTQTLYSDVDYMVLCYCIEKITGKRFDDYLKEIFWDPMGLTHVTYNPLENGFSKEDCVATELMGNSRDGNLHYTGIRTDTVWGEVHDPNAYYCMDGVSGHAGMFSNASDLAILASVMLTGGYGENKFFSQEVLDQFVAPKSLEVPTYGLGWWREADHGRDRYFGSVTSSRTYGHQGFTGTLTMIDPDNNMVIVLLTNKIHSTLLPGDETLSAFRGNYYTTSSLGFAPEIIQMGLEDKDSGTAIYKSLLADMIADSQRKLDSSGITDPMHPRKRAHEALLSVYDLL